MIIFKDGTKKLITTEQYAKILKDSGEPGLETFKLDNREYYFRDIKKITSSTNDFNLDKLIANRTPEKRLKVLEALIIGLENYIKSDRYQGTDAPKKLLKAMKIKRKTAYNVT